MKKNSWIFMIVAIATAVTFGAPGCKRKTAGPAEPAPVPKQGGVQVPAPGGETMQIQKQSFGSLPDGTAVDVYTLTNKNGLKTRIATYGGTIISLETPDRTGRFADVVLGHDSLAGYLSRKTNPYFGSLIGRFANRIGGAAFWLDGEAYRLAKNDGESSLHGGFKGFDAAVWQAEPVRETGAVGLKLSHVSADGDEGYPGNLSCTVVYMLTDEDELKISYEASTDKATPVNLTNHAYFNLKGQGEGDILGHELMLNADEFLAVTSTLIPTGEIRKVKGTPYDFTRPKLIGADIAKTQGGFDNCYVIRGGGGKLQLAARVVEPGSGRVMEISTTEPAVQFYTGNFLDGTISGKDGKIYGRNYGFCLETQRYPDAPNHQNFPSAVLRPGQAYKSLTVHKFSAR